MTFLSENKKYVVLLTTLGTFIFIVLTMIAVYKWLPEAKEIIGFFLGAAGTFLILLKDAFRDFLLNDKEHEK